MSEVSDEPPQPEAAPAAIAVGLARYREAAHDIARFLGRLKVKRRRSNVRELLQLDDYLLRDIGFSRDQIEREG